MNFSVVTSQFWSLALQGLALGLIYALVSLGYTMVYGVLRLINFANSEVFMFGTFATLYIEVHFLGYDIGAPSLHGFKLVYTLAFALLASMLACAILAIIVEFVAYRRPRARGANRLASNSLLGGLVFSARIAADIAEHLPEKSEPIENASQAILLDPKVRHDIQVSMSRGAGVLRSSDSLLKTSSDLTRIEDRKSTEPCVEAWETTNLFQLAQTIVKAALIRQETRGSHWREDFPETSDLWKKRIVQQVDQAGYWTSGYQEVGK